MDKPTTLRLSREQQEAVTRIAERLGVSEAAVIRWAVDALLQHAEAHGGSLVLPLDLSQQWVRLRPQTGADVSLVNEAGVDYKADPLPNAGSAALGQPSPTAKKSGGASS